MSSSPTTSYRFSIRRPVTVAMIFLTLIVFGWKSYEQLPLNLMPDISYPTLTVRTEYEGAAPEDVVELITEPLEERLSVVSGMVELSSKSSPGLSEIVLEFTWGTNMDLAMQDVRETLDVFTGPQDMTRRPIILRYDPTLDPVMRVAITGRDFSDVPSSAAREDLVRTDLTTIRTAAERQIKNDLEAEVGVAQIEVQGGREEEIRILVDAERIKNLGLSLEGVVQALSQQNINRSGGRLKEGKTEYLVRTLNEFENVDEIREVIIPLASGDQYRLEELAQVFLGEKDRETIVRVNGQEAVELKIYKEGDANTVQVCKKLKEFFGFEYAAGFAEKVMRRAAERMPEERRTEIIAAFDEKRRMSDQLRSRLPGYAEVTLISDQSRFIEASIKEVQSSAITGGLLALAVLYLFLKEIRSTIIIGVAIPISVVATFVPMFIGNVSLNIMSLGGLALGIGNLVDNSIVVLESIFRCKEEGDGPVEAAERGTKEVAGPVTASTLTTVAVFAPIVFVEGIAGQMFRDLALTVTFSQVASLIVALYLVPMIASRVRKDTAPKDQTVWLLRGYFESRQAGKGRFGALVGVGGLAPLYVREWFRSAWEQSVMPAWRVARGGPVKGGGTRGSRVRAAVYRCGVIVALPIVLALFVIQAALRTVATVAITLLFGLCLLFLAAYVVIAKVARVILYLPIYIFDKTFNAFRSLYRVGLTHLLPFSPLILLAIVGLTYVAAIEYTRLGQELLPQMKQGEFTIQMVAPPGTRLEDTEQRAAQLESIVSANPYVDTVTVQVGRESSGGGTDEGENVAQLSVKLSNPEQTVQIQDEVIDGIRTQLQQVSSDEITFSLPSLFSFKTAVEVHIFGENLEQLRALGETALASIGDIEGIKDAELSLKRGYPEVIIEMDRDLLAAYNISPAQVGIAVQREVRGEVATRFGNSGEKIDIRVQTDESELKSVQDLRAMSVTDASPPTPLSAVATLTVREGPSEIRRIDQRHVVLISANVEGRDLGGVARDMAAALDQQAWPAGYSYRLGGQQRELETSYSGLLFALGMAVFLVYVVMACQFESIWHPALIMFTVPLALIGVVYALKWTQIDVNIVVMIGCTILAGVIVNNAIVLIDYINVLRARGVPKKVAIVQSASVRLRPILMTATTTVLGLVPMALSTVEGAEIRRPLAITVMAGLISGTVLTLVVIPMLYHVAGGRDRVPVAPNPELIAESAAK